MANLFYNILAGNRNSKIVYKRCKDIDDLDIATVLCDHQKFAGFYTL